jgi:hypothetical protein
MPENSPDHLKPYQVETPKDVPRPVTRLLTNPVFLIPSVALTHQTLFLACLFLSYGAAMRSIETGLAPTQMELFASKLLSLLSFPAAQLARVLSPGGAGVAGGWAMSLLNSLLWGIAASSMLRRSFDSTLRQSSRQSVTTAPQDPSERESRPQ